MKIQDDSRETALAKHCGLRTSSKRTGRDATDAQGNEFELKSATGKDVTTGRDVSLETIKRWRSRFWIIAWGKQKPSGFEFDKIYIAHPEDLDPVFSRIERRLRDDYNSCRNVARAATPYVSPNDIVVIERVIARGITLNNPKIPGAHVESHCTALSLDPGEAAELVAKFVASKPNPILSDEPPNIFVQ